MLPPVSFHGFFLRLPIFFLRVKSSCFFLVAFFLRDTKRREKSCYLFFCMLLPVSFHGFFLRAFFFKASFPRDTGCFLCPLSKILIGLYPLKKRANKKILIGLCPLIEDKGHKKHRTLQANLLVTTPSFVFKGHEKSSMLLPSRVF